MSERSIFVLAVVLVVFNDLLPSARQVEDMTHDVARAPAYTVHEVRSDLASLSGDFSNVRRQVSRAPVRALSFWSQIHSDAIGVYADARADAREAAQRFAPHGDAR
jgi:hypothetical protein